jgi:hypothetical protein
MNSSLGAFYNYTIILLDPGSKVGATAIVLALEIHSNSIVGYLDILRYCSAHIRHDCAQSLQ